MLIIARLGRPDYPQRVGDDPSAGIVPAGADIDLTRRRGLSVHWAAVAVGGRCSVAHQNLTQPADYLRGLLLQSQ